MAAPSGPRRAARRGDGRARDGIVIVVDGGHDRLTRPRTTDPFKRSERSHSCCRSGG
jgi:hypothetical protein